MNRNEILHALLMVRRGEARSLPASSTDQLRDMNLIEWALSVDCYVLTTRAVQILNDNSVL